MKKFLFFSTAMMMGAGLLAGAAQAEEFDGIYGGLQLGYGGVKYKTSELNGGQSDTLGTFTLGGLAGYRSQIANGSPLVLGVEADLDYLTKDAAWRFGGYGLAGIRTGDKGLLFARLGYSKLVNYTTKPQSDLDDQLDGLVLGAGYEYALNDVASLRLDYRHSLYGKEMFEDSYTKYRGHEAKVSYILSF